MINFSGQGILLDVEGTTSAVAYVYDVMFPFANNNLTSFLDEFWDSKELESVKEFVAKDAGTDSYGEWIASTENARIQFEDEINRLMAGDIKATGLKQLQGLIWESGFKNGQLKAHVFEDVQSAFKSWQAAGIDLRIYSSGSIHAQKLFFGHSEAGDLLNYLSGHYDTTTGPKRESESYRQIASDWKLPSDKILFLSDITEELNAARDAGLQTALVMRPGNATPCEVTPPHPTISSFDQIQLPK